MAHVPDLKVPHSSKSVVVFNLTRHIRLTVDVCGKYGHVWNWQDMVPQSIDTDPYRQNGPHLFHAPLREGYAWACEREGCEEWLSVSQMDSERQVPKPFQEHPMYGGYGRYAYVPNSPFCGRNQSRAAAGLPLD
jgi:hypothetical protein